VNIRQEENQTRADSVDAFLRGEGGNVQLADGLLRQTRWWLGPRSVRIQGLTRCCEPEEETQFRQGPARWHERVQAMMQSLEAGWQAPPLVVELRGGMLSMRDGNHRLEALARCGQSWAVAMVWFNSEEERERFQQC